MDGQQEIRVLPTVHRSARRALLETSDAREGAQHVLQLSALLLALGVLQEEDQDIPGQCLLLDPIRGLRALPSGASRSSLSSGWRSSGFEGDGNRTRNGMSGLGLA